VCVQWFYMYRFHAAMAIVSTYAYAMDNDATEVAYISVTALKAIWCLRRTTEGVTIDETEDTRRRLYSTFLEPPLANVKHLSSIQGLYHGIF